MTNNVIIDALSLGWGTQSTSIALASGLDLIPRPDKVYFADLHRESQEVYDYIEYFTPILKSMGIEVTTLNSTDIYTHLIDFAKNDRTVSIPLWFMGKKGKPQPLKRQCTGDFKIEVIARAIRNELSVKRLIPTSITKCFCKAKAV